MGSLELIGRCGAAIRRPVRDMLPVSKCMGYMSIPRASLGQARRAGPQEGLVRVPFLFEGLIFQSSHCVQEGLL